MSKFPKADPRRAGYLHYSMRNRQQQIKERISSWNHFFMRCKLRHHELNMNEELDKLCTAQENLNIVDSDGAQLAMSFYDKEGEKKHLVEKLSNDRLAFVGLNEESEKLKELLRSALESLKKNKQESNLTPEDSHQLDKKNQAYRNDIAKFDKKHPWLKNPQLDLAHIAKEAQSLASMQEEKEALEKELDVYQGLKPDLKEAFQQLSLVKKQYKDLKDNFHQGV